MVTTEEMAFVEVYLLTGLDEALWYREGGGLPRALQVGDLVRIPLLRRTELGVIASVGQEIPEEIQPAKVRDVIELV